MQTSNEAHALLLVSFLSIFAPIFTNRSDFPNRHEKYFQKRRTFRSRFRRAPAFSLR